MTREAIARFQLGSTRYCMTLLEASRLVRRIQRAMAVARKGDPRIPKELPPAAEMTREDLEAEVEGGRIAYAHLVELLQAAHETLDGARGYPIAVLEDDEEEEEDHG